MWRTICISWWGVQYIVSSAVTYILFSRHTEHFLLRRTSCISWCDILPVFPVVEYNTLYLLVWHIYCSSDINNISWYGVLPFFFLCGLFLVFPDVMYIALCLLIWCVYCSSDINDVSWYVAQPLFPNVAGFLHFLMWCSLHCRSWSGIYIVLQINITNPVWRTSLITWCGVLFVFPDVTYNILYLLMWRICYSSDIDSMSW